MTSDEARMMANVNTRALRLFEDGYRCRFRSNHILEIRNADGTGYLVDRQTGTCTCPFYQRHDGRHPCKHLLGADRLLIRQRECRRLLALTLLKIWASLDDQAIPESFNSSLVLLKVARRWTAHQTQPANRVSIPAWFY